MKLCTACLRRRQRLKRLLAKLKGQKTPAQVLVETHLGAVAVDRTDRIVAVSRLDWQPLVGSEVYVVGDAVVNKWGFALALLGRVVKVSDA